MNEQERTLLRQLGRTARGMYVAFEAEVGYALPRWRILQALRDEGNLTQKQLAEQLTMDPGALTRQLKVLESEGLITRRRAPADNRLSDVSLTAEGTRAMAAMQPLRQAFTRKVLRGLPKEEMQITMTLLARLEERFRRMGGQAKAQRELKRK
ncbi:MAG: MarR family transcriptional regulator [Chromatiales bacterium]|jgi:DNA-binding MarR family transcriptional regulator|nr:MarR family transcriptional regulator [Chromatiales bacterium]